MKLVEVKLCGQLANRCNNFQARRDERLTRLELENRNGHNRQRISNFFESTHTHSQNLERILRSLDECFTKVKPPSRTGILLTVDRGPWTAHRVKLGGPAELDACCCQIWLYIDDNQANALRLYNVVQRKDTLIRFGG